MNHRVLFITGAGSDMGQMTAQQALDDGWKVAALDLNAEGLDQLGENSDLLKIVLDVTDRQAVATAVEQCRAHCITLSFLNCRESAPQKFLPSLMPYTRGGADVSKSPSALVSEKLLYSSSVKLLT